jgi:branched-subunit amino acid transport protein
MDATRISLILIMGLMAFGLRALPQIFFVSPKFPAAWEHFLRYLSYALICSMISTTLFMTGATFDTQGVPSRAAALAATILVAHQTKSAVTGMLVGTIIVLAVSWLR